MIDEIERSFSRTLDYLARSVEDVPDDLWTGQPAGAVNHPAWVVGHLVHSCQAIGGEMGIEPWLPADWGERFGTGSAPIADRKRYLSKAELLEALADGQRRITERLTAMGEAGLAEPLPDVRYREMFPTVGHAVLHLLTAHAALHVGQLTVWRRVAGLGPSQEPFI
jgi:uncharacterized damage-inducible protein DinB